MSHDHVLQIDARDPLATRLDDVLCAVHDLDIALRVNGRDIAGLEPAVRRKTVGRFEVIVAADDPRTPDLYLAHGGTVPGNHTLLLVHQAEVHPCDGVALLGTHRVLLRFGPGL